MEGSGLKDASLQVKEEDLQNFSVENVRNMISPITEDGSVDRKGNPAVKGKSGGWTSASLLLVNQSLSTLAFFGVGVNLVLFLTRVLRQDNADAANNVSKWSGTVYTFSLIGAFMSDSYWGRYLTCAVFQAIFVVGLILVSLSSWLLLVRPSGCGDGELACNPASALGSTVFYASIYLVAFGYGGYQPVVATLGADQFDENDPGEGHSKVVFFSYFYFALNAGSLFSNTVLAYFEDSAGEWPAGFWTAAGAAAAALLLFSAGTPRYRHFRPCGNPLTRIAQVIVAAARKWGAPPTEDGGQLYEVEGKESAIAGSRKILHTEKFGFLDRAATFTDDEYYAQKQSPDPWRLCTVTQVEEVKCVLKMLPIWLCTIIYSAVFTQMSSLFVEQGDSMDTTVAGGGGFRLPAASMSVFDILSVLAVILLYRRVLVPAAGRLTGNAGGISHLHRMAIGLAIAMLAMVAAGIVELERLKRVTLPHEPSSLSILWQIPQYVLIGASEFFMYVGQLEFFNEQAPDGIKSFGSSLCMASIAFGNYFSSMLVSIVVRVTSGENRPGWIPSDLNTGHLDRFFFLLAGLTVLDLSVYLFCAKWYNRIRLEDGGVEEGVGMV